MAFWCEGSIVALAQAFGAEQFSVQRVLMVFTYSGKIALESKDHSSEFFMFLCSPEVYKNIGMRN